MKSPGTPRGRRHTRDHTDTPPKGNPQRAARAEAHPHSTSSPPPVPKLHTPSEAAGILAVRESWLRRKAGQRLIPCTFLGKHLRFSDADLTAIADSGHQQPVHPRGRRNRPA